MRFNKPPHIITGSLLVILASFALAQNPDSSELPPPMDPSALPGNQGGFMETGANAASAAASAATNLLTGFLDPFDYDSRGRRDPFAQPIEDRPATPGLVHGPLLPLQLFDLNQIRLVGIIWDVSRPKAMLRDPSGKTHIVGPNTKIGPRNGYIAVIREGEMVVVETIDREGKLISTSQVVKIAK